MDIGGIFIYKTSTMIVMLSSIIKKGITSKYVPSRHNFCKYTHNYERNTKYEDELSYGTCPKRNSQIEGIFIDNSFFALKGHYSETSSLYNDKWPYRLFCTVSYLFMSDNFNHLD